MAIDVMKIEFTAEDKTKAVVEDVKANLRGAANEVTAVVDRYKGYAVALAGVFGIKELADFVVGVAEAMGKLHDLAAVTGSSTGALQEFQKIGKLTGTSVDDIGGALTKLAKNMQGVEDETGKAAEAFHALGISTVDANGKMKSTDQVMLEIAKALDQYEDGANKTALAQVLLGKTGAQLIPFMKDLSAEGKDVTKMTDEQRAAFESNRERMRLLGEQADTFGDNLTRLQGQMGSVKKEIAAGVIPVLSDLSSAVLATIAKTEGLTEAQAKLERVRAFEAFARATIEALSYVLDAVEGAGRYISSWGEWIGGVIAVMSNGITTYLDAAAKSIKGDFRGAWDTLNAGTDKARNIFADMQSQMSQTWASQTYGQKLRENLDRFTGGIDLSTKAAKDQAPALGEVDEALDSQVDSWNKLVDELQKSIVADEAKVAALANTGEHVKGVQESMVAFKLAAGELGEVTAEDAKKLLALAKAADDVKHNLQLAADAQKESNKQFEEAVKLFEKQAEAEAKATLALNKLVDQSTAANDEYRKQTELLGLNGAAREKMVAAMEAEKDIQAALNAGLPGLADSLREQLAVRQQLIDQRYESQERLDFWSKVGDHAAEFGRALLDGPGKAFDYLKNMARQLLEELIGLFARRFVLQIAASVTGMTGLDALAGSTGAGSFAGSLLNSITGGLSNIGSSILSSFGSALTSLGGNFFGGLGSLFGNIAAEGLMSGFAGTFSAGVQALMSGNLAGAAGSLLGPIGAALGAVALLVNLFGDKGENPKLQFGWGPDAIAQSFVGVFGPEGFVNIQTNDSFNKALEAAMLKISTAFDENIAKWLSPEELATVIGNLANVNSREFAFPKGDETMGEQALLQWLKDKYSTVLAPIDEAFAASVANWTGTSEELVKAIGAQLAQWQAVSDAVTAVTGAIGLLPPETLKAKLELVELSGGLQQFTQQANFYLTNFYSDSERAAMQLDSARQAVTDGFAALGITAPQSRAEFRHLVESLDLSTESGRSMYAALMQIAPAFVTVSEASDAAAAAMLGRWGELQEIIGTKTPDSLMGTLPGLLAQFRQGHSWARAGDYADNSFLIRQLSLIGQADFGGYSAADQSLIVSILRQAREAGLLGGNSVVGGGVNNGQPDGTYNNFNDGTPGNTGSTGSGNYVGTSFNMGISAAEFIESVKTGMKQALAESGITTDTQRNESRFERLQEQVVSLVAAAWKGANALADDGQPGQRTAAAAERTARNTEPLLAGVRA